MTEATTTAAETTRAPDLTRQTPGEFLRRLREEKGLTHAVVGQALHLTVHYIKALESDEYGKLPGLTFVKGYLRAYARFLGADVENVIARFDEHITGLLDAGMHTARVERSKRRQDQALRWAIGAGFVVVAALVSGWWFMSGDEPAEAPALAATQQPARINNPPPALIAQRSTAAPAGNAAPPVANLPAPTPNVVAPVANLTATQPQSTALATQQQVTPQVTPPDAAVTSPALTTEPGESAVENNPEPVVTALATGARLVNLVGTGADELRVTFRGNSWIEVDDGSMVRLYNDMLRTGDTLTIRGTAPFHVLLGDASQVAVSLNAAAVDISADIRDDSTARLVLGAPAAEAEPATAGAGVQ